MSIATLKNELVRLKREAPPPPEPYTPCCDFARQLLELGGVPVQVVNAELKINLVSVSLERRFYGHTLQRLVVDHSCRVNGRCEYCRNYWALEYIKSLDYKFIIGSGGSGADPYQPVPEPGFFFARKEPRRAIHPVTSEVREEARCYIHHSGIVVNLHGHPCPCYIYQKDDRMDHLPHE